MRVRTPFPCVFWLLGLLGRFRSRKAAVGSWLAFCFEGPQSWENKIKPSGLPGDDGETRTSFPTHSTRASLLSFLSQDLIPSVLYTHYPRLPAPLIRPIPGFRLASRCHWGPTQPNRTGHHQHSYSRRYSLVIRRPAPRTSLSRGTLFYAQSTESTLRTTISAPPATPDLVRPAAVCPWPLVFCPLPNFGAGLPSPCLLSLFTRNPLLSHFLFII